MFSEFFSIHLLQKSIGTILDTINGPDRIDKKE